MMFDYFCDLEQADMIHCFRVRTEAGRGSVTASRTAINNAKPMLYRSYWYLPSKPTISHSWSTGLPPTTGAPSRNLDLMVLQGLQGSQCLVGLAQSFKD